MIVHVFNFFVSVLKANMPLFCLKVLPSSKKQYFNKDKKSYNSLMCLVSNFVIYLYIFYKEQLGWTLHTSWKRCARDFCKCEECMESISIPPGPILGCVGGGWPRLGRPYGSRRSAHPSVRPSALTTACTQHTIPIVACLTGNRSIV